MRERIGVEDAPPPPPPDDGKRTPDVSQELANALTRDDQGSYPAESRPDSAGNGSADQRQQAETPAWSPGEVPVQPEGPDAHQPGQELGRSGPGSQAPDLPQPEASAELRSAIADFPPAEPAVEAVPVEPAPASDLAKANTGVAGDPDSAGRSGEITPPAPETPRASSDRVV